MGFPLCAVGRRASVAYRLAGGHHSHDAFLGLGMNHQRAEGLALERHQVFLADQGSGVHVATADAASAFCCTNVLCSGTEATAT